MTEAPLNTPPGPTDREINFMITADQRFRIVYLFPHPPQRFEDASLFGWYTPGLLATAHPFLQACSLPADVREAHSNLEDVLLPRLTGLIWPLLLPVEIDSLDAVLQIIQSRFVVCVTTDAGAAAFTDEILKTRSVPPMHVSTVAGPGRVPLPSLDYNSICTFVRKVLDALAGDPGQARFVQECRQLLTAMPQRKLRKHPMRAGMHNVTAPNETALAAFGYKFLRAKAISEEFSVLGATSADAYVARICQSADAVSAERAVLLASRPSGMEDNRAIVAVATLYAPLYRTWKEFARNVPDDERQHLRTALAMAYRSETYSHAIPIDDAGTPAFGKVGRFLIHQLGADMRAFTAALGMLSSATLSPVLRLEPKLNRVRADAAELARCVRAQRTHTAWKQSRMVRLLGQKMRSLIHPEFLARIDAKEPGRIEGLKLVTDLPLELMPSDGMPLGLRFDVSRVSPMPGNLFWQTCHPQPVHIPVDAFYEVLVVRSFSGTDPLRTYLQRAIDAIAGPGKFKRLKYRFVDVQTPEEFSDAINAFDGPVMIFDGHGRYDADLGIGRPVVGGKPLDPWALKRVCHMPPVVMFSACDTQPIEGSHGSVATAAFALGARAVLGSMFPVNAGHASIMMARMLLRMDQFLPVATTMFPVMTWRHVVSGMLRMSHTTEAARALNARAQINLSQEALSRVQMVANVDINNWEPAWHDRWIDTIAQEAGRSSDDIRALLAKHVGLTDAMKYVQLGFPERVIIH